MPAYRLLALDMDGTLLTSEKRISPRTVKALRRAANAGVSVVLSTGRTASELVDYLPELTGIARYASILSGGAVRDLSEGTSLYAHSLPAQVVHDVVAQGLSEDAMVQPLTPEVAVMTLRDVDRMPQIGQGAYHDLALRLGYLVDDIATYADAHARSICKINLHHVSGASCARSWQELRGLPVQLATGESASIEVTPQGVTKASGLAWICDHLGMSLSETVVVGDGDNDLDALRVAGLAVAMGNARPAVLDCADVVVADNDHDGIAEVVDRWL